MQFYQRFHSFVFSLILVGLDINHAKDEIWIWKNNSFAIWTANKATWKQIIAFSNNNAHINNSGFNSVFETMKSRFVSERSFEQKSFRSRLLTRLTVAGDFNIKTFSTFYFLLLSLFTCFAFSLLFLCLFCFLSRHDVSMLSCLLESLEIRPFRDLFRSWFRKESRKTSQNNISFLPW